MNNHPNFKNYMKVRKLHGVKTANYLFPDVMWHLWEKKLNHRWKLIWGKN